MLSVCVSVCLDVNQGGTNRNRCTQRLVVLHTQRATDKPWSHTLPSSYIYWILCHNRRYFRVYCLCKLPTYGHQICLRTFQSHRGQNVQNLIWARPGRHKSQRLYTETCSLAGTDLMNPDHTPETRSSWPTSLVKIPKTSKHRHFQASWQTTVSQCSLPWRSTRHLLSDNSNIGCQRL